MSLGLTECILLDNVVFLSIPVMKVAGISPFNHLKCINWRLISAVTLLYKLQNATEKVVFRTNASSQNSQKGLSYAGTNTLIWNAIAVL